MKIVNPQERFNGKVSLTIGMFDGVHRGHRELIKKTIESARAIDALPAVYTFINHPVKEKKRYLLTALEEKLFLLEKFGIEVVFLNELSDNFMKTSPLGFIQRELLERINVKKVVVGEDFKFGFERKGDVILLKESLEKEGITVETIPIILYNGESVKSTAISKCIKDGSIDEANGFLGYKFFLSGSIVKGKGLGRHLGFPTANLMYLNGSKVLPKNGVYITLGELGGNYFYSVSNVGFNPTFENDKRIKVEVHFLNTQQDLYGEFMRLYFLERIRDEKKFEKEDELRQAVFNDIRLSNEYFNERKALFRDIENYIFMDF